MAIININSDYRIASDSRQWMVQKPSTDKKTGETMWTSVLFFSSLDSALRGLSQRLVRESDAEGMAELAEESKRITAMLQAAVEVPGEVMV